MKKLFILPAVFCFAVVVADAQGSIAGISKSKADRKVVKAEKKEGKKALREPEGDEVEVMVKDHFYEDFGNVDPSWKRTKYFDEASFVNEGRPTTAFYNAQANLVGMTHPAEFTDIPANAQKQIRKDYRGYDVKKVILFDDNREDQSEMMLYGSTFNDGDNYFVEMTKGNKSIVLEVDMDGLVSYFAQQGK